MDVVTAFLYRPITEEVYIKRPTGFMQVQGSVCRLNKALYGLKQSPRIQYHTLIQALQEAGFTRSQYDHSLFIKSSDRVYMVVYIDDLLIFGPEISRIQNLKNHLTKKFRIINIGLILIYLNINISKDLDAKTLTIN